MTRPLPRVYHTRSITFKNPVKSGGTHLKLIFLCKMQIGDASLALLGRNRQTVKGTKTKTGLKPNFQSFFSPTRSKLRSPKIYKGSFFHFLSFEDRD